jgi:hypothetical protein
MSTVHRLVLVCSLSVATPALADDLRPNRDDYGHVSRIDRGVWTFDAAALGVMSVDQDGDTSVTRMSTDLSIGAHYFVHRNVSVGVSGVLDVDSLGGGTEAITYGATLDAAVYLRLGLGAFFRPGIAVGALVGNRSVPQQDGTTMLVSQTAGIVRFELPIAYFASPSWILQAGPQFDVTAGSYAPDKTFTRIAGGFAVGIGHAF